MRAIQRVRPREARLLDVEVSSVSEDDVVVDVLYAGVNPFDMQVLRGEIGGAPDRVLTLGAEATGLLDGELVLVSGDGLGATRDGTFADHVAVPRSAVRWLPAGTDPVKAATVGVAGKTAWRAVHQLAAVRSDDVVLVLGGSGGVGIFATQLARAIGAEVLVHTASPDKARRLAALDMETVVADSPQQLSDAVARHDVSVVLDPLGGDYVASLMHVLRPAARVVSYGVLAGPIARIDLRCLYQKALRIIGNSGSTTPADEREAAVTGALEAVLDGTVRVEAEAVDLDAGPAVLERLTERSVHGKLVFEVARRGMPAC